MQYGVRGNMTLSEKTTGINMTEIGNNYVLLAVVRDPTALHKGQRNSK